MLQLSNEQKALFSLLGANWDVPNDVNWAEVEAEAMQQAVYILASRSPRRPKSLDWNSNTLNFLAENMKSFYAISKLDSIMREQGFKYVILKGLSAASYYPEYMNRILGDCDFLIDCAQKEQVKKVLLAEGYEMSGEGNNHHVVFRKPDQDLEMHFEIPGVPDGELGNVVRDYVKNVVEEGVTFKAKERDISIPLPKYHGLIILLHMQHHMLSEGVGIRHLMDWCMFVDKTFKDALWETDLLPILKSIGMYKYAQVMTKIGSMYLGTASPKWCVEVEEELCDDMMHDILTGGNFGRKNQARAQAGMMIARPGKEISKKNKIFRLWKTVLGGTKGYHYHTLEKYPFLYPVFIIEFMIKRVWNVFTGKKKSLKESSQYVKERQSVYDRLEIFGEKNKYL